MPTTEQITVRLPVDRVKALKAAAKAEHRSLAQQVEHHLSIADKVSAEPSNKQPDKAA